jgi:hypothetical protein
LAKGLAAENLRAGAAALLAHEAPSAEPELCLVRDALIGLVLLPGDGQTVCSGEASTALAFSNTSSKVHVQKSRWAPAGPFV